MANRHLTALCGLIVCLAAVSSVTAEDATDMEGLRAQVASLTAEVHALKAQAGVSAALGESISGASPSNIAKFTGAVQKACKIGVASDVLPKLFSTMVNGGAKAQREIQALKTQVAALKTQQSGGGTAARPSSPATSAASVSGGQKNGVLATAIGFQTPSQVMAVVLSLNSFLNALDYGLKNFVCHGYEMDDATACDGVVMQKYESSKGKKNSQFKLFDKKQYYVDNSFRKGKRRSRRDLGERHAFKRQRGGFTCVTRTSRKGDAMRSCQYPTLTPAQRAADDNRVDAEWEDWFSKIGELAMQKYKEESRSLGEASDAKFIKKIGNAVKKGAKAIGNGAKAMFIKLAKQLVPQLMRANFSMSKGQYKCMCSGYIGQLSHADRGWIVAPGFRKGDFGSKSSQGPSWHNSDFGKDGIFFSILKVRKKDSSLNSPRTDRPLCKYDVKMKFQNCFKPTAKFQPRCAINTPCKATEKGKKGKAKGKRELGEGVLEYAAIFKGKSPKGKAGKRDAVAKLTAEAKKNGRCEPIGLDSCKCNACQVAYTAKKALQCNPNPKSCNGSTTSKDIKIAITHGGKEAHCRRSFAAVDSIVRGYLTMATAVNNEKDQRLPCDKMLYPKYYEAERKKKGKNKGKNKIADRTDWVKYFNEKWNQITKGKKSDGSNKGKL